MAEERQSNEALLQRGDDEEGTRIHAPDVIEEVDSDGETYYRAAPVKLSPEQVKQELDRIEKMPLFMEFNHEEEGQGELNPEFEAIKALQKEESPEDIAENYKDSGNEAYKRGKVRYHDALRYYELALEQNCSNKILNAQIYSNKAQVHLAMENYGKAIADCKAAIRLDKKNLKAYFRAGKATLSLGRYEECLDFCRSALFNCSTFDQKKPFRSMIAKAKEKQEVQKAKEEEARKAAEEKESTQLLFLEACKLRKIKFVNSGKTSYKLAVQKYDCSNYYDAANHELHWSVLILYPEHCTSDFIMDWNECIGIWDMLATIFPSIHETEGKEQGEVTVELPEWDKKKTYYLENLRVFVEKANGEDCVEIPDLSISLGHALSKYAKTVDCLPVLQIEVKQSL